MGSDRQYLAYGLLIGILIAAVLMAAVLIAAPRVAGLTGQSPTQPAVVAGDFPTKPAPTPAATPTFTPIPPSAVPINIPPGLDLAASPTPDAVLSLMKKKKLRGMILIGGGIIPDEDQVSLRKKGVAAIFTPGAETGEIVRFIQEAVGRKAESKSI